MLANYGIVGKISNDGTLSVPRRKKSIDENNMKIPRPTAKPMIKEGSIRVPHPDYEKKKEIFEKVMNDTKICFWDLI